MEAILVCEDQHQFVRTKHIAAALNVKSSSVNAAVKELSKLGYVEHESYGHIDLTPPGRKKARMVLERHHMLYRFLHNLLGLPERLSEEKACAMEHHLDDKTFKKLTCLLNYLDYKSKTDVSFARELRGVLDEQCKGFDRN